MYHAGYRTRQSDIFVKGDANRAGGRLMFFTSFQVPTLGSQEGAFENVRMTFSGEQGQTIRQLIGAHVLRRVAMCCLASPKGRRQHLAVSHEKGKVCVYRNSYSLYYNIQL